MSRWAPLDHNKVLDHLRVSQSIKKTASRFGVTYERIRQIAEANGCSKKINVPSNGSLDKCK